MSEESCATCRFYDTKNSRTEEDSPTVTLAWPIVRDTDWCGEYEEVEPLGSRESGEAEPKTQRPETWRPYDV